MNGLFEHIQYLLVRHNCVVLPTLGAFLRRHCPARIDEENRRIIPPEDEISFNEAIKHDDALLASSVARRMGIPYQEALLMVYDAVAEIKVALEEEGEVTIGNLGTLRRNGDGKLNFTYLDNPFNNPSRIGTLCVSLGERETGKTVSLNETLPIRDGETELKTADKAVVTAAEEQSGAAYEKRGQEYYYIAINKKVAKFTAMAMLFICVALSTILPLSNQTNVVDRASVLPIDTMLDSAKNKMPVSENAVQDNDRAVTGSGIVSSEADEKTAETAASTDESCKYHLIVATFSTLREADKFIETNSQTPYPLYAVTSSTLCRVSAKGSDNSEELYALLSKDEFKRYFREAWVWKK